MPDILVGGTGDGYSQKVNGNNRAYVNSVSMSEGFQATKIGNSYNINTGIITLTNAVDTPLIYLKNTGEQSLHITAIAIGLSPSVGGSGGIPIVTVLKNPTAGTIVTSQTSLDINSNRNFGSSNSLTVVAYKGATGLTMTDGDDHLILFQTSNGRLFATVDAIIPKGSSIGIKLQPQSGNTSQSSYAAIICHEEDINE